MNQVSAAGYNSAVTASLKKKIVENLTGVFLKGNQQTIVDLRNALTKLCRAYQ